jgi:hypothetical protein
MHKRFTKWGHCVGHQWSYDHIHEYMNIMRVNIGCFTGCKRIKQRRISFVPGYLRMLLWKISTAISIKHRILATFNIKKIQFWQLYAFKVNNIKTCFSIYRVLYYSLSCCGRHIGFQTEIFQTVQFNNHAHTIKIHNL